LNYRDKYRRFWSILPPFSTAVASRDPLTYCPPAEIRISACSSCSKWKGGIARAAASVGVEGVGIEVGVEGGGGEIRIRVGVKVRVEVELKVGESGGDAK
jgi:hypothetical protein